jgi:hypothetical protein
LALLLLLLPLASRAITIQHQSLLQLVRSTISCSRSAAASRLLLLLLLGAAAVWLGVGALVVVFVLLGAAL